MFLKAFVLTFMFVNGFRETTAVFCIDNPKNKLGELEELLFCNNSDYNLRPVKDVKTVTIVDVMFIPLTVTITEEKGLVKVSGYLYMSWMDEFKQWKPSSFDNIAIVKADLSDLWQPKLTTAEGYTGSWHEFLDEYDTYSARDVRVSSNGTINMKMLATIYGPCDFHRNSWPFDIWTCKIIIAKRKDDDDLVVVHFKNNAIDLSKIKEDEEWLLVEMTDPATNNLGNTQHIELRAVLKRHMGSYFSVFLIPGLGIYFVALLPFCLGSNTTSRLIIHFLAATVEMFLLQYVFWLIGNTGSKGVTIHQFYLDGVFVCFIGIFVTFLNVKFNKETKDPPRFVINFLDMLGEIPYMGPCLLSSLKAYKTWCSILYTFWWAITFLGRGAFTLKLATCCQRILLHVNCLYMACWLEPMLANLGVNAPSIIFLKDFENVTHNFNDTKPGEYDIDNECLISQPKQYNQKWITFLNFIDKSVCFLIVMYLLIKWLFW